jgi:hypothetical protein
LLRKLHFLLDSRGKIGIISHQVTKQFELIIWCASALIETSGSWVHSILRARACFISALVKVEHRAIRIYFAHPNTTADKAGSPVGDDLQRKANATLNLRACPNLRPVG